MKKKKVNIKKTVVLVVIGILIIIGIVGIFKTKKQDDAVKENTELSNLERNGLNSFVENLQEYTLINTEHYTKNEQEIEYAVNEYIKTNSTSINGEAILEKIKTIFGDKIEITEEEVNSYLRMRGIVNLEDNTLIGNLEDHKTKGKTFANLKEVKKIGENNYKLILDVVETVDIEKLRNYYMNPEVNKNNLDLTQLENPEYMENLDLSEYLNKENYQEIANSIRKLTLEIEVQKGNIIITNFEV